MIEPGDVSDARRAGGPINRSLGHASMPRPPAEAGPQVAAGPAVGQGLAAGQPVDPSVARAALRRYTRTRFLVAGLGALALAAAIFGFVTFEQGKGPSAPEGGVTRRGEIVETVDFAGAAVYRVQLDGDGKGTTRDVPAGDTDLRRHDEVWVTYDGRDRPAGVSKVEPDLPGVGIAGAFWAGILLPIGLVQLRRALRMRAQFRGPLVVTDARAIPGRKGKEVFGWFTLVVMAIGAALGRVAIAYRTGHTEALAARLEMNWPRPRSFLIHHRKGAEAIGAGPVLLPSTAPEPYGAYSAATGRVVRISRR